MMEGQKVKINEVFPNPKGKDTGKEFIELYNPGNENVNLENWKIVQQASSGKSTEIVLSDKFTIKAKGILLIEKSKKAIRNSANKIFLKDSSNNFIDEVEYQKSKEDLSLSRIQIKNTLTKTIKTTWEWQSASPNKANKNLYIIEGKIVKTETENSTYKISLNLKNGKILKLLYKNDLNAGLAKIAFKKDRKIKVLISKGEKGYEITRIKILFQ